MNGLWLIHDHVNHMICDFSLVCWQMGKTQFQTTPIVILQAKYSPYQVQRIRASEDAVKDAQLKLLNPKTNTPEAQRLFDHFVCSTSNRENITAAHFTATIK